MTAKFLIGVPQDTEEDILVVVLDTVETPFTDNVHGTCFDCGRGVQFRPYHPPKPKRICMECLPARLASDGTTH